MSKFSRGTSAWKEYRIADAMRLNDIEYMVEMVARRGTGFSGYRVTLYFLPRDGGEELQVELENAASTADLNHISRELSDNHAEVERRFAQAQAQ